MEKKKEEKYKRRGRGGGDTGVISARSKVTKKSLLLALLPACPLVWK